MNREFFEFARLTIQRTVSFPIFNNSRFSGVEIPIWLETTDVFMIRETLAMC
jgi:hypothetical protein